MNDPRMEKPLAIRHALLRAGMHEPAVAPGKRRKRYAVNLGTNAMGQPGGRKQDVALTYIVANFEVAADAPWKELAPHLKRAEELWSM